MAEQATRGHDKEKVEPKPGDGHADAPARLSMPGGYLEHYGLKEGAMSPLKGAAGDKASWQSFINQCTLANSYLNQCYSAGEAFIRRCSSNYKAGYDAHKAALDRQSARDQLNQQLILGVIFAAAGGAAGGAVGAAVSPFLTSFAKIIGGAVTDTLKDLTKYLVRMGTAFAKISGGQVAGNTSETPPDQPAARPVGSPAGLDPFTWHNLALLALATEREGAFRLLTEMQASANGALNHEVRFFADFDPFAVAQEACKIADKPLAELANLAVPTADQYERAFWVAWLGQYGYRLTIEPIGNVWYASENVPKEVRKEIDLIAGKHGENGQEWIRKYGAPAKERVEKEAAEENKNPLPLFP